MAPPVEDTTPPSSAGGVPHVVANLQARPCDGVEEHHHRRVGGEMAVISKVYADSSTVRERENLSRELVCLPGALVIQLLEEVETQVCPGVGAPEGWNVMRSPETRTDSYYLLDSPGQCYLVIIQSFLRYQFKTNIKEDRAPPLY